MEPPSFTPFILGFHWKVGEHCAAKLLLERSLLRTRDTQVAFRSVISFHRKLQHAFNRPIKSFTTMAFAQSMFWCSLQGLRKNGLSPVLPCQLSYGPTIVIIVAINIYKLFLTFLPSHNKK